MLRQYLRRILENRKITQINDSAIVLHQGIQQTVQIHAIGQDIDVCSLPDSLVISPGIYQFFGQSFDCRVPGIYRFSKPQKINLQRLVFDENNAIHSALYFSLISCRGNSDDDLPHKAEQYACNRLLAMTCGPLVNFTAKQFKKHGMICRPVSTHTLEPMNSYNNGHKLLEVWHPEMRKFVVVDMDKKCYFTDGIDFLNIFELTQKIHKKQSFELIKSTHVSMLDWTGFKDQVTQFNYQFIEYAVYGTKEGIESYLRRICQVPIIQESNTTYVCAWNPEVAEKLNSINCNWTILTEDQFYDKFYQKTVKIE